MNAKLDSADVVIIGGGTIGTSVAYHLSKYHNKKIILIDRNGIGTGNTAWAASLLTLARGNPDVVPMVSQTYQCIRDLEKDLGERLDLHEVGSYHVANSDRTAEGFKQLLANLKQHNIEAEWSDPGDLSGDVPWLDVDKVNAAFYTPGDGFMEASVLANAFARAARENDVVLDNGTEVLELLVGSGGIEGVRTDRGIIETPVLVDAAGAWSNLLSMNLNIGLPMAPVRSIYWITERNPALFSQNQPMVILPDEKAYTRPESGGLLFGVRDSESTYFHPAELPARLSGFKFIDESRGWEILEEDGAEFRSIFKDFDKVGIAHTITGVSTYTADGQFVIGESEILKGFYAATGCVGAGVATSGGFGRLIAEMINGGECFIDVKPFSIERQGSIDPFSKEFMQRCSNYRAKKKDG
jgi:4-methylaminobutanoate oxidase (formaldehyde-forming)